MKKQTDFSFVKLLISGSMFFTASNISAQQVTTSYPEQYLNPEFTKARVLMKGGSTYEMKINYNVVFEKVELLQSGKICDLANPGSVDTIYLMNRKFVPAGKIFFELLSRKPYPLFIEHRANVTTPPRRDSYGKIPETSATDARKLLIIGDDGKLSSEQELIITKEEIYRVQFGNSIESFKNPTEFFKIFPSIKSELKSFIRQNKIKFENPEDIKKLLFECNRLLTISTQKD